MMIVPGNLDYSGSDATSEEGNPITRVLFLVILASATVLVMSRMSLVLRVWRYLNVYILLFMGLAVASIGWSIDPELTVRGIVRMATMFAASLAVAVVAWHPRRYQQLIRPVLTFTMLGSIAFGLMSPQLAIHHEQQAELLNAWHGLYATKNALGPAASLTFILWAHAWLTRETNRGVAVLGMAAAAVCLVLSRSSTSIITTVFTVLTLLLLLRSPTSMRRSVRYMTAGLVVVILLYSLAMLKVVPGLEILVAPIPAITGKDLTFSNRANIWAAVVDHVKIRPLFGSGYSAYWTMGSPTPDMESFSIKSKLEGFYPGSSHNGYLQVLNDLGAVGLCFLLGYIWLFVRDSIRLYNIDRSQGALFLVLFLQQATVNLTEPLWLNVLLVDFVLMLMATTCLARALLEAKTRPRGVSGGTTPGMGSLSIGRGRIPGFPSKRAGLSRP